MKGTGANWFQCHDQNLHIQKSVEKREIWKSSVESIVMEIPVTTKAPIDEEYKVVRTRIFDLGLYGNNSNRSSYSANSTASIPELRM